MKKSKINFRQKVILVLGGLLFFLILLEAALRLGGVILLSIQERRNLESAKKAGAYRILCLGESTTQGQYPQYLEGFLNANNLGIDFSVIDKGLGGTHVSDIVAKLPLYIKEYRPDMVVVMMGINDEGVFAPDEPTISKTVLFMRSLKLYKLGKLMWMHLFVKMRHCASFSPLVLKEVYAKTTDKDEKTELDKAREAMSYLRLGWVCKIAGEFAEARKAFLKALELDPAQTRIYRAIAILYWEAGMFDQTEEMLKAGLKAHPESESLHIDLGWLYHDWHRPKDSEEYLKRAIAINPQSFDAYLKLGWFYRDSKDYSLAEEAIKKAIVLNKQMKERNEYIYLDLGWVYCQQGKFLEAEEVLKEVINLNPEYDRALGALALFYSERNKPELAREYLEKADALRMKNINKAVGFYYLELKRILDGHGIKLVCSQYPMRSPEPLRKIFRNDPAVVFVDNEGIFQDAVRRDGVNVYFRDMFAGDFGHCTEKGNRLLARNIAETILKEAFHQ